MYSKIYLRLEPLGLELVAAAAREAGHSVRLIDLLFQKLLILPAPRAPYCPLLLSLSEGTASRSFRRRFCGTLRALWIAC